MQGKVPISPKKRKQLQMILLRKNICLQIVSEMEGTMMMQMILQLIEGLKSLNNLQLEQNQKSQLKVLQKPHAGRKLVAL